METYEPITETMTRLAGISDAEERMKALREVFWRVDNEGMQLLASKVSEGSEEWNTLLKDMQVLTQERMETGMETLKDLLSAGEITVLDSKITKNVRTGVIDPAFLSVLNLNIDEAQKIKETLPADAPETDNQLLPILIHIYTRVQEEMEKRAKPSMGLVHKLLRLMSPEFAPTRANILEDTLKPKPEEEREMVFLDGELVTDYGAKVAPLELSKAIKGYMDQIRGLDQVEEARIDEDTIGQAFEDCRVIAKEARAVVERLYDQEALDEFTDSLTPVFEPIMATLEKYRR